MSLILLDLLLLVLSYTFLLMLLFVICAALPWQKPTIKQARNEDEIIKDLRSLNALFTHHVR